MTVRNLAANPASMIDPTEGLSMAPPLPRRHPWRVVGAVAMALVLVAVAQSVISNPRFQWAAFAHYMFHPDILEGVAVTIGLTVSAMLTGCAAGIVVALMRLSPNPLLANTAVVYIAAFRGVPALVQLLFWFNLAALYPVIAIGVPFGPTLLSLDANAVITPLVAATLGLGLCEGAYMAEIVRGGILSVDRGQTEAALAVGMTRGQAMRQIILPQALRVIIPPTGNQVIGMMKYTSLASVISLTELLASTELIYTRTFETIPLLLVASAWYMILTAALTLLQRLIEHRVARSEREAGTSSSPVGRPARRRWPARLATEEEVTQ